MNRTTSLLIILLLAIFFEGTAQIKKAEKNIKFYNYSKAIPFLLKAVDSENETDKNKAIPMLADCYRLTNNVGEARHWYEKTVEIPGIDTLNYYYLAQAYRSLGSYEKAHQAFQVFDRAYPDTLNTRKHDDYCVKIQDWLILPPVAEIKNVRSINSRYSDFGACIYKNGVVFASDRKKDQLDDTYGWTNFNYLNLYSTEPEYYRNLWSPMKPERLMEQNFNQPFHDGPATFTSDFSRVYVTKTTEKNRSKAESNIHTALLKIFYADIVDDKKLEFVAMPFNHKDYSVAHPTLSPNNQQMIFSSDQPGGYGGSDLYISTLDGDEWSTPINLGDVINTEGNEVFPHWAKDSVLYFSSDDHMGYGGLDIFKSVQIDETAWTVPVNIKAPINSSYDDFALITSESGTEGLFSSNRPEGEGSDDIYAFRNLSAPEMPLLVSGYVKEMGSLKPIEGATVFFFNPKSNEVEITKTNAAGYYELEAENDEPYLIKAMKDSFMYDCLSIHTPEVSEDDFYEVPRPLLLNRIRIQEAITLEIFYDLDKSFIRVDAEPALDSLVEFMQKYPVTAELSSHTDSRATDEYNMNLSQRRAVAAVNYIVSHGISESRITARGYGESRLVNHCADDVECTDEEHQANRRTEFKVTEVDMFLLNGNIYDLNAFRIGDKLNPGFLGVDFFKDCDFVEN